MSFRWVEQENSNSKTEVQLALSDLATLVAIFRRDGSDFVIVKKTLRLL